MVFSDTTNKNGIIQRYERHTLMGDGVVSGDNLTLRQATADINDTVFELESDILLTQDGFDFDPLNNSDIPVGTVTLEANRRFYGFDNINFLALKRMDVAWDGSTFYRATPMDSGAYDSGLGNDTETDKNFDKTKPVYDPQANGFKLYPIPDAEDEANGAKARIEFRRLFDKYEYNDTSKVLPFDSMFQELVPVGAALRNPGLPADQYQKLSRIYGTREVNGRGEIILTGGRAALAAHYNRKNEDFSLSINPLLDDYS